MSEASFDKFLKLNASRGGRDKIYRVIQYAMKTNNALYEKPPPNLKRMESSLSAARHVFRLTTFIESLYGLGSGAPNPDFISSIRQVVNAIFAVVDTIDYLAQFNVLFSSRDLDKWDRRSTQLWMYGLILGLIRDALVFSKRWQRKIPAVKDQSDATTWLATNKDLVCDTLKNACDLSLPLKALGYLPNVNPALIAFLGTMSSLFGIFPLVNPEYKMP